ncbi:MAG: SusD/RagB family nutrient-binding outer membrane lipoprotein [Tannerella sp.]|jgi:hypothetical protein|nr:SusD/RagB family nutrient-binding outer membrane lipoprotein [Tannerella sp.]
MKKVYKWNLTALALLLACAGCGRFEDINTNPDTPTTSTAAMLATGQIKQIIGKPDGNQYFSDHAISKHIGWGELPWANQYNRFERYALSGYTTLTNTLKMVELAADIDKAAYQGLALFIKACSALNMTLALGDIPYSEALQGETGITKPRYDTQKEVMLAILNDLDEAYRYFSEANRAFEGDIIYGGDPARWKIAIAAFELKILLYLSRKESDADLNVKQRFARIVGERPLMTSNSDNFQLVYGTLSSQIYPTHSTKNRFIPYPEMSNTVVDTLKKYGDRRLFYFAQPARARTDAGIQTDDWEAYAGIDPSLAYSDIGLLFTTGNISNVNLRFYELETCQPTIKLGYAEQNLILAEACLRGWIQGDAGEYYRRGIEASLRFTAEYTPDNPEYHHNMMITDDWIRTFLDDPALQLVAGSDAFEANLNKIITQKYLNSFMHDTYTSYYEYRRTGYPKLPVNPATNMNTLPDRIPVRWMYDQREYDYNRENVEAAVQRQFGGNDDVNERMWILE